MSNYSNEHNINDILKLIVRKYGLEEKLLEQKAIDACNNILDRITLKYVEQIYLKEKILYIKLSDSSARNNLKYNKTDIRNKINLKLEKEFITDIRLL